MNFSSLRLLAVRLLCALVLCAAGQMTVQAAPKQPLTVARALETTRIMGNASSVGPVNPQGAVSISPGGKRYVIRLVRGDVQRNGVWMEILSGRLDSFEAAAPKPVARLFTSGLGAGIGNFGADQDLVDFYPLRWLDDSNIVFLWSDERSIRQATRVNLDSGTVDRLTSHSTSVAAFDLSHDGTVLYAARAQEQKSSPEELAAGFVIPDSVDAHSLYYRNLRATGFDIAFNTEWFVQERSQKAPRAIRIAGRDVDLLGYHGIQFSPDGKTALLNSAPEEFPAGWDRYTGGFESGIVAARRDVRSSAARTIQQLFVLDVASGKSRPLWNTITAYGETRWSADGRTIVMAPAYLPPPETDPAGFAGRSAAIIDVATGRYARLSVDLRGRQVTGLRWIDANEVEIESRKGDDVQQQRFRKRGGQWRALEGGANPREKSLPPLRIEMRQDLNTPPRLFAVELRDGAPTGREQIILDPNPGLLDTVALGKVELIQGKMEGGDSWQAYLYYPVDYKPGQRYPLLLQSVYGAQLRSEFTLYGLGNLGPTVVACYPGQVMANRGVAVLHINVLMGAKFGGPEEGETRKKAFVAAVEQLVTSGLADRAKIGLAGFSRNGWYTEYTLTHSDFPFAAAIAADNWDPSYIQTTWFASIAQAGDVNGGEPFGEGLKKWMEKAPGFNADRVRVPLLKIEQSTGGLFGVMAAWEMFSRLRYLNKPVEFYVMPGADGHGAHNTQNPGQILAVQQRAVDWFDFWLNGHEDSAAGKSEQYTQWRKLRAQHLSKDE